MTLSESGRATFARLTVAVAVLAPMIAFPLSGARLSNPGGTIGWAMLCAASLALAPGRFGQLSALLPLLSLPVALFWIGVVAVTGTGPTPLAVDIALEAGSAEIWTSLKLAFNSSAFLVTGMLCGLLSLIAWRLNRVALPKSRAQSFAFLLTLLPFAAVVADGHQAPLNEFARYCSPEARRSVPLISAFGMLRNAGGMMSSLIVFGPSPLARTARRVEQAPKTFDARPGLVVLILGDSMRPDALIVPNRGPWSKQLQARIDSGLGMRLPDTCASGNGTFVSIPLLITNSAPQPISETLGKPTILALAKASGASTAYISNHEDFIIPELGHDEYASVATLGVPAFDEVAITALEEFAARKSSGSRAAWVHLYGQHLLYSERYPAGLFPDPPTGQSADEIERLQYSNAAEYGAKVLLQAAALLDRQEDPAVLIFTSDHGENLWSDGNRKRYHAGPVSGLNDTLVPALVLWNNAFLRSGAVSLLDQLAKARQVLAHRDLAAAWLALVGYPQPPVPTVDPTTWGAIDDGKGIRVLRCAELPL